MTGADPIIFDPGYGDNYENFVEVCREDAKRAANSLGRLFPRLNGMVLARGGRSARKEAVARYLAVGDKYAHLLRPIGPFILSLDYFPEMRNGDVCFILRFNLCLLPAPLSSLGLLESVACEDGILTLRTDTLSFTIDLNRSQQIFGRDWFVG